MKFRPCIDLHAGKVKQIVGSSLTDSKEELKTNFETKKSTADYAEMYRSDGLVGGHVIMLGPNCEEAATRALKSYPQGLQIGGGITASNAEKFLNDGASHVIVTSYIFNDGQIDFQRLEALSKKVGKGRLVLDISCRKKRIGSRLSDEYFVVTNKWQTFTDFELNKKNIEKLSEFCDEFLVHGVEVEGKKCGILEDLVQLLGEISPIPVTYAGGVRGIDDLNLVKELGKGRVDITVGSALDIFGGDLPYSEVVKWNKEISNVI
mmetsp:Transcript_3157/g.4872  ORF Transcript_3157/g.4872 Transcript_3157/m.4872 type:complete len:263 (+) Transcript_3157:81-869(+)